MGRGTHHCNIGLAITIQIAHDQPAEGWTEITGGQAGRDWTSERTSSAQQRGHTRRTHYQQIRFAVGVYVTDRHPDRIVEAGADNDTRLERPVAIAGHEVDVSAVHGHDV